MRIPHLVLMAALSAAVALPPAQAAPRPARAAAKAVTAATAAAKPVSPPARALPSAKRPAEAAAAKPDTAAAETQAVPVALVRAISTELRAKAGGKLKTFYRERNFAPLWAADGTIGPEADALIAFADNAGLDGLRPSAYDPGDLREAVTRARGGDAKAIARAELKLSNALARYAGDLRKPQKRNITGTIFADSRLIPQKPKENAALRGGALASSFARYVTGMQWMSPHYLRMRFLLGQAIARGMPEESQRRIRLNLERARLLPGPWTLHIAVDAGSARLYYYQAGKEAGSFRVVVGKPASPTPMMAGMVQWAVLNPYWNVPVDLAQKNIAPKVLSGRRLRSMRMEAMSDWSDGAKKLDPAKVDWQAVAAGTQELRVRQLPGPGNSMGKVKFLFPNEMGIYLHDTSEKELMLKPERHLSNGCIRLEDAAGLGKWLLGRPVAGITTKSEQPVALRVPVPVYLTYFTVTGADDGAPVLLDDVYGRDGGPVAEADGNRTHRPLFAAHRF